jgi:hypothetical protein
MPKVDFPYKKSNDYRTIMISGIFGGVSPQGFVFGDLFFDKVEIPEKAVFQVEDGSGKAQEIPSEQAPNRFVREALVRIMMQPEVAEVIGKWLIEQAKKTKQT